MTVPSVPDVLIIGDGIAGCTTAITAQEAGAKVLIIDKAPENLSAASVRNIPRTGTTATFSS